MRTPSAGWQHLSAHIAHNCCQPDEPEAGDAKAGGRRVGIRSIDSMESVWDYPRPPAVEACEARVRVLLGDATLVDSRHAFRVLETSHPPTIYVPPRDVAMDLFTESERSPTFCEFKGRAHYLDVTVGERTVSAVAWTYRNPSFGYELLRDHLAFYADRVDEAWLDQQQVDAQESGFYGGWVTPDITGPFKGPPGTRGW